jgi:hypothetical protein
MPRSLADIFGACGCVGIDYECSQYFDGKNLLVNDHLGNIEGNMRKLLRWILRKSGLKMTDE